jgi:hypothetical protein
MSTADPIAALVSANPVTVPDQHVDAVVMARTRHAITAASSPVTARRPRWPRPALVAATAAVAAVAALTLTATVGHRPGGLPGVVDALADTIGPEAVLHTVDDGPHVPNAAGGPAIARHETWASLDGLIQRTRTTYADGSFDDLRVVRRHGRYQATFYRSATRELSVSPWQTERTTPAQVAGGLNVSRIRRYARIVDSGRARVDGSARIGGHAALRVVDTDEGPANGTIWFVATDTDTPTLLAIQPPCRGGRPCPKPTTYTDYDISDDRAGLSLPDYRGAHAPPPRRAPARTVTTP